MYVTSGSTLFARRLRRGGRSHSPQAGALALLGALATVALAPAAATGESAPPRTIRGCQIALDLHPDWQEHLTTGSTPVAVRQILYVRETDEGGTAHLDLTVMGPSGRFSMGAIDLRRREKFFRERLALSSPGMTMGPLKLRTVAGGEKAVEILLTGNETMTLPTGKERDVAYQRRVVQFMGRNFAYTIAMSALDDDWPEWETEWEAILAGIDLDAPDRRRVGLYSPQALAIFLIGILAAGLWARSRFRRAGE